MCVHWLSTRIPAPVALSTPPTLIFHCVPGPGADLADRGLRVRGLDQKKYRRVVMRAISSNEKKKKKKRPPPPQKYANKE